MTDALGKPVHIGDYVIGMSYTGSNFGVFKVEKQTAKMWYVRTLGMTYQDNRLHKDGTSFMVLTKEQVVEAVKKRWIPAAADKILKEEKFV